MTETLGRPELRSLKKYIPGKSIEEVQREYGLTEVIKLASNENPLGSSPKALAAMQAELAKVNLYPEPTCPDLTRELAAKVNLAPENILFGNGADGVLTIIAQAFVSSGDEAIFCPPTFVVYDQIVQVMGGVCRQVPMGHDFRHNVADIVRAITPKTKLILICNPNNPTGTIIRKNEMDWLLERVLPRTVVVLDEAYCDFVEDADYPDSLEYIRRGHNVIVLRTFSKIYGLAGVRIGYALSTPDLVDTMAKVRESFPVNRVAQAGARAALGDDEFRQRTLAVNRAGKRFLYERFGELGLEFLPTEANFVFVNLGVDSKEAFQRLLRLGVVVRPGFIWDLNSWARVTIGTQYDNEKFIAALEAVLRDMAAR